MLFFIFNFAGVAELVDAPDSIVGPRDWKMHERRCQIRGRLTRCGVANPEPSSKWRYAKLWEGVET